jgi:hypothetical protein
LKEEEIFGYSFEEERALHESVARTAAKALKVLQKHVDALRLFVSDQRKRSGEEDFTFSYEEEADPEIFFVPYVWEVIVCVVTSSSVEWNKDKIQVFPLLEEEEVPIDLPTDGPLPQVDPTQFSKDVSDLV